MHRRSTMSVRTLSSNPRVLSALELCQKLKQHRGIYSVIAMKAAGFQNTDSGDTAHCSACDLTLSDWSSNVEPFTWHAQERPDCTFVRSIKHHHVTAVSSSIAQSSINDERPSKRQKVEVSDGRIQLCPLIETGQLKQAEARTFASWPERNKVPAKQMIEAGFFNCNVGDRVICIYCNLICQHWTPPTDDPLEVHQILSPRCPFITAYRKKMTQQASSSSSSQATSQGVSTTFQAEYAEVSHREASFARWPANSDCPGDTLAQAGFFYTGRGTTVACFSCNGSWEILSPHDEPVEEHARRFPRCLHAREQCGADRYEAIQSVERAKELDSNIPEKLSQMANQKAKQRTSHSLTKETLSKAVESRLDLPVSRRLMETFHRCVVERCWRDQFILNYDDFSNDCDLWTACTILQKQLDHIHGDKTKITVPHIAMENLRNPGRFDDKTSLCRIDKQEQTISSSSLGSMRLSFAANSNRRDDHDGTLNSSNLCLVCLKERPVMACIPCGHLAACVSCGDLLRMCPICRKQIEAFVRVHL